MAYSGRWPTINLKELHEVHKVLMEPTSSELSSLRECRNQKLSHADFDRILQRSLGKTGSICSCCSTTQMASTSNEPSTKGEKEVRQEKQRESSRRYRLQKKEEWVRLGIEKTTLLDKRAKLTLEANQLAGKVQALKKILINSTH